jgi:hypothetical protein
MTSPRTRLAKRLTKIGTLLAGVTLLWACNAPPIVVPPPAVAFTAQTVTDSAGNQKTVWTAAQPTAFTQAANARFYIYDETSLAGIIQTADANGMFTTTPTFDGNMGDHIQLYYETPATDYSDAICLILSEARPVAPFCQ